jgi:hypothetical protein
MLADVSIDTRQKQWRCSLGASPGVSSYGVVLEGLFRWVRLIQSGNLLGVSQELISVARSNAAQLFALWQLNPSVPFRFRWIFNCNKHRKGNRKVGSVEFQKVT